MQTLMNVLKEVTVVMTRQTAMITREATLALVNLVTKAMGKHAQVSHPCNYMEGIVNCMAKQNVQ